MAMFEQASFNQTRSRSGFSRSKLAAGVVPFFLTLTPTAHAEGAAFDSRDLEPSPSEPTGTDASAFLVAGKVGGIVPFGGLEPFVVGGIELGYVFAGTGRRMAVLLDATYTAPFAEGTASEEFDPERIPDGEYAWELRQKLLVLQPTFTYSLRGLVPSFTPYAGIGPRVYLLESVARGSAGGERFQDTTERSTKFGVGVPLGAEFELGPGSLFAEFLFQWAPIDHTVTGETHLASGSLFLGYRALF